MWWDILKNLKGKAKGKGSTLDASKIKVNIKPEEDNPCKKRLKELIDRANKINKNSFIGPHFPSLPEETACRILENIKKYDHDIDAFSMPNGKEFNELGTKDHRVDFYCDFFIEKDDSSTRDYRQYLSQHPFAKTSRHRRSKQEYGILVFSKGNMGNLTTGVVFVIELNYENYKEWSYDI